MTLEETKDKLHEKAIALAVAIESSREGESVTSLAVLFDELQEAYEILKPAQWKAVCEKWDAEHPRP